MNLIGYDHSLENSKEITADINQWRKNTLENIDVIIEIIISIKNIVNNICIICGPYATNWISESNLTVHYKYSHRSQIVDYYLEHFIQLTPNELREQMQTGDDKLKLKK